MKTTLHHFAYNIAPHSLELILELFESLGCKLEYKKPQARWCMVRQPATPIDIQLIETSDQPVPIKIKKNAHIAFLSANPKTDLEEIKQWAGENKINFIQGNWSEKELWFDLPDLFINFVIEIMHTSVVE
tara:strand:- start:883 stop:1272 length:390 start_codon:yes stop_codon:yes gene_type:complete